MRTNRTLLLVFADFGVEEHFSCHASKLTTSREDHRLLVQHKQLLLDRGLHLLMTTHHRLHSPALCLLTRGCAELIAQEGLTGEEEVSEMVAHRPRRVARRVNGSALSLSNDRNRTACPAALTAALSFKY